MWLFVWSFLLVILFCHASNVLKAEFFQIPGFHQDVYFLTCIYSSYVPTLCAWTQVSNNQEDLFERVYHHDSWLKRDYLHNQSHRKCWSAVELGKRSMQLLMLEDGDVDKSESSLQYIFILNKIKPALDARSLCPFAARLRSPTLHIWKRLVEDNSNQICVSIKKLSSSFVIKTFSF